MTSRIQTESYFLDPGAFLFTYVFLMLLGELVHIGWLALAENVQVRFLNKPILYGLSAFQAVLYIILIILQSIIWTTEY